MNQLMLVGNGVVFATTRDMRPADGYALRKEWGAVFPDIPIVIAPECRIVCREGQPILFEFTGGITETFVAEFKRWWEEANNGK